MLVLGSQNSSNSRRLAEIAHSMGKPSHLIDGVSEIQSSWFDDAETVLITAGFLGVVASLVAGVGVFIAWMTGNVHVAGYTPLMLMLFLLCSSILLALGIVGQVRDVDYALHVGVLLAMTAGFLALAARRMRSAK